MNKRSLVMLVFLFYTILALIIFIPTILWASQFFKFSQKGMDSYKKLVNTIEAVKDGEMEAMPLYMDDETVIAGVSVEGRKFEHYEYLSGQPKLNFYFNKPIRVDLCQGGKACICLWRDFETKIDEGVKVPADGTGKLFCEAFDKINFLSSKVVNRYGNNNPKNEWRNGFIFTRDIVHKVSGMGKNTQMLRTIYVQRYKNFVDVCLEAPCITDEIKEEINKEDAILEFNRFIDFYNKCKKEKNKECGEFHLELPLFYYIYYHNTASGKPTGFYLVKANAPEKWSEVEIVKKDNKEVFVSGEIYDKDKKEYKDGNLFLAYDIKLSNKEGLVIMEITTEFIDYIE